MFRHKGVALCVRMHAIRQQAFTALHHLVEINHFGSGAFRRLPDKRNNLLFNAFPADSPGPGFL